MSDEPQWIAAIEAGGTKFVCAAGRSWQEVRDADTVIVATSDPGTTLGAVGDWLREVAAARGAPAAVGVASFGPVDLASGKISATTPKLAWRGFDWRGAIDSLAPGAPAGIETDTNAAALAEHRSGAAAGATVAAYVTVGTGIGAGIVVSGSPLHGLLHPEFGHQRVPRRSGDDFAGVCPSHGDCLEGMASGPALQQRWSVPGGELPPSHGAWELEAHYLACGIANLAAVVSPEAVVLGGGVMSTSGLLEHVRARTDELLNGYVPAPALVRPGLAGRSGVVGAFLVGEAALRARPLGGPAPPR